MDRWFRILSSQLRLTCPLPEALLRAAASHAAGDVDLAALLAARLDLPADLRERMRADHRAPVRAAYLSRDDVETSDLCELLADETRTAVLAPLAAAADDPALETLLWQRLLAKPTKTTAVAMVRSLTSPYWLTPGARTRPPVAVLVTALSALGPRPALARHPTAYLEQLTEALAGGAHPAAAELLAQNASVPEQVRVALAATEHLSSSARVALLDGLWEQPLLQRADKCDDPALVVEPFSERVRSLPGHVDVLAAILTAGDVADDVLARAAAALESLAGKIPPAWADAWRSMLTSYQRTTEQGTCAVCADRAVEVTEAWPPAGFTVPDRDPHRGRTGPGADAAADTGGGPDTSEPAGDDADRARPDLEDLDDTALSQRLADGTLTADEVGRVTELAEQRRSMELGRSLLEHANLDSDAAVALVTADWFRVVAQVIVRLVQVRSADPDFALAAAGREPDAIWSAFGPGVFAGPGAPAAAGAVRFARQVTAALGGADLPGWAGWTTGEGVRLVTRLQVFVAHPDTTDEALLELPWPLVAAQLDENLWNQARWHLTALQRLRAALAEVSALALGDQLAAWDAYARISDSFTGTVRDLFDMATACTAAS